MGKRPPSSRSLPIAEAAIGRQADILLLESPLVHGHINHLPTIIWYIRTLHHGGWWQAEAATRKPPPMKKSRLGEILLQEVLWGFMSATVAQRIAAAAIQDGCSHADLTVLAGLGTDGEYPANAWRDLERKLPPNTLLAAYNFVRNLTPSRHCMPHVDDHLNCP